MFTGGAVLIQADIKRILVENELTLSTAESCTGGTLCSILTSIPGASGFFLLGCVPYGEEMKVEVLGIDPQLIEKHSAVSSEVALEMARRIRKISGSDIGIATTGYAGPGGGGGSDPVGTVYIAISMGDDVTIKRLSLEGDREQNITKASETALRMLYARIGHLDLPK